MVSSECSVIDQIDFRRNLIVIFFECSHKPIDLYREYAYNIIELL